MSRTVLPRDHVWQGSNSRAMSGVLSQCLTSDFLNLCPAHVSRDKDDVCSAKISSQSSEENYPETYDLMLLFLLRRKCCIAEVVLELLQSSVKLQPFMR